MQLLTGISDTSLREKIDIFGDASVQTEKDVLEFSLPILTDWKKVFTFPWIENA
jgi:hypothetical protein